MIGFRQSILRCLVILLMAGVTPGYADEAGFPKSITIIVGFAPGGGDEGGSAPRSASGRLQPQPGYDQTARLFARHIGGFLPGNPSVAVRHMPGAGSIKAAVFLAYEAPVDGSVLGVLSAQALLAPLIGAGSPGYKLSSFAFIGGRSADEYVCAADGESGIETLADVQGRELPIGVTAPGRRPYLHASLLKQLTGAPLHLVSGYRDNNELLLALRRGEISGICGISFEVLRAGLSGWISSGRLKPLMRFSPPWLERLSAVPRAQDIARQQNAEAGLPSALEFMALEGALAWTLAAPAGVSRERVLVLRNAFVEMQKDRSYLREAARRNLDIDPVSAGQIENAIEAMSKLPETVLQSVRNLMRQP